MAARDDRDGSVPPSFSPSGSSSRPQPDGAQPVGPAGRASRPSAPARTAGRTSRSVPAEPPAAESRRTGGHPQRVSTRGTAEPAGRSDGQDGTPASYAPRRTTSSDAMGASNPPPVQGTRVMPAAGRGSVDAPPRTDQPARPPAGRRRRRRRRVALTLVLVLLLLIAWPVGLVLWANGKIQHVDALSAAAATPGVTYLLTGSDTRADGAIEDDTTVGARTDTILLLHVPESGPSALISLPRDTYVDIPGYGPGKLNAAFSWGGAPLLVQTVEGLTGLTVDHYAEIGFAGLEGVVDALGGVELCLDDSVLTFPLNDANSGLSWPEPGCRDADGTTALAFARMRYADPTGDIGRGQRQRQLISAITSEAASPSVLLNPVSQVSLVNAGTSALVVSEGTGLLDLGTMAIAFRNASGDKGVTGTPPIASLDYRPGGLGSTVLLDSDQAPTFFAAVRDGTLEPGVYGGVD